MFVVSHTVEIPGILIAESIARHVDVTLSLKDVAALKAYVPGPLPEGEREEDGRGHVGRGLTIH